MTPAERFPVTQVAVPQVTVHTFAGPPPGPAGLPIGLAPAPAGPLRPRLHLSLPGRYLPMSPDLSSRWALSPDDDPDLDVAVLLAAEPPRVRALLAAHPSAAVLAVVDVDTPVSTVVQLFEAGADACVRGGDPGEVRAHLAALERRRSADREAVPA